MNAGLADLTFRPACPADAPQAAAWIASTMGMEGVCVLGLDDPARQLRVLEWWFRQKTNRFSYRLSSVAEITGQPAGLLVGIPGAWLDRLHRPMFFDIWHLYGLRDVWRFMRRARLLMGPTEAQADEYLIAHLAVSESYRRRGLGQALLERARSQAAGLGLKRLVLEVDVDNEPARRLYQREGFEVIETVCSPEMKTQFNYNGYERMAKNIDGRRGTA